MYLIESSLGYLSKQICSLRLILHRDIIFTWETDILLKGVRCYCCHTIIINEGVR